MLEILGLTSNDDGGTQSTTPEAESSMKESLKLTGRVLKTVITRAADVVDTNPAKVVLGLVKTIIKIKDVRRCSCYRILTNCYLGCTR